MSGKVVGFTGRVLDTRTHGVRMKYVNSPDSEIYHKTNELYGIDLAKRAMSKQGEALLVEGQADVISLSQRGVENVVAGSGTALTIPQIKLIHRFTPTSPSSMMATRLARRPPCAVRTCCSPRA